MTSLGLGLGLSKQRPLAPAFNPMAISSMGEWFDIRTLAGTPDSDPVGSWAGRKGLYTAAATGSTRPTYVTDAGDGRGAVRFDGVDDTLQFAMTNGALWGPNGEYEFWAVVRSDGVTSAVNALIRSFGTTQTISLSCQNTPRLLWYSTNQLAFSDNVDVQDGDWHVLRYRKTASAMDFFVDGVQIATAYPGSGGAWDTGADLAFIGSGGGFDYWPGDMRHVMTFTAPLADLTAEVLTEYLTTA